MHSLRLYLDDYCFHLLNVCESLVSVENKAMLYEKTVRGSFFSVMLLLFAAVAGEALTPVACLHCFQQWE